MKVVLKKCDMDDFEHISKILDSNLSFTNDSKRKELLDRFSRQPSGSIKTDLIELIDKQIRYYGSSDVAYLWRSVFSDDSGVSAAEIVDDVSEKLKVKVGKVASLQSKLKQLTLNVVEKELSEKTPEELKEALRQFGVGDVKLKQVTDYLEERGKILVLPVLVEMLGPAIVLAIVEVIVVTIIAQIIGREAAKLIFREVVKRNPYLNVLGPIVWILSGVWLAFDLQGPAFRKTVPICLYLGMVTLREDAENALENFH